MGLQGYNPSELVEILTPYFLSRDTGSTDYRKVWTANGDGGASWESVIFVSAVAPSPTHTGMAWLDTS